MSGTEGGVASGQGLDLHRAPIALAIGIATTAIAIAITATSAQAATRADWVAQVDPVCQNAQGQEAVAAQPLPRAAKRVKRHPRSRKADRAFTRAFRAYFGQYVSIERAANAQIATLPPATEDVSLVQVWLRARGELLDSETQLFFGGFKPKKGFKGLAQVFTAFFQLIGREQEVTDLVRDFGFHYCNQGSPEIQVIF